MSRKAPIAAFKRRTRGAGAARDARRLPRVSRSVAPLPTLPRLPARVGELRAHFGLQIAYLAIEYGLDIEAELAQIIPPELRGEIDDERGGR